VTCDQGGRLPMFWLADRLIHIRLTDASGVVQVDTTMQVLGPSSGGGGGGGTVDPTTIASTGDEKIRYDNTTISGWVRENGLTVGNATSGASERANADTQNLFVYLYNKDPNLIVVGGRTGNALNDYNASKQITLPDMRGRAPVALADMGNSASSVLPTTYCSSPTTLGFSCGSASATLGLANLPPITSSGVNSISVTSQQNLFYGGNGVTPFSNGGGVTLVTLGNGVQFGTVVSSGNNTINVTSTGTVDTPFGIVMPIMLRTFYVKL
jgi:hypothetical protein